MYYEEQCNELWELLGEDCKAIYLGGSQVNPIVDDKGDCDLVVFCDDDKLDEVVRRCGEWRWRKFHEQGRVVDIIPCCDASVIEIYSYLNGLRIRMKGSEVQFPTNLLSENRQRYIDVMYDTAKSLYDKHDKQSKKWYHILEGSLYLMHGSFEFTQKEKHDVNWLHKQYMDGREDRIERTYALIRQLKEIE